MQANSNGQIFGTLHTTLINTPHHPGVIVRGSNLWLDPDVKLSLTNTFHVGFRFNDPADASACGFTGFTPFNGENHAGPLAMISIPSSTRRRGGFLLQMAQQTILLTDEVAPPPALIRAGLDALPAIIRPQVSALAAASSNSLPPASATATPGWPMRAR